MSNTFVILLKVTPPLILFDDILKDHYSLKTGGLSAGMTHLCTKYKIECRTIYGLTKFISNYLPGLLHNIIQLYFCVINMSRKCSKLGYIDVGDGCRRRFT